MAKVFIDVMWPGVNTSQTNLLKLAHMYAINILGCAWNVDFVIKGASGLLISKNIASIVHRDEESEWFELVPALEGDIVEVTKETLEANIALVKKEINPKDDDDDEDLPNWFQCVDSLVLFLCISQSLYRLFLAPIYCWFPYKGTSLKQTIK